MVKLTKEVELHALEEKRIANKLKEDHVIKDADKNKQHMPSKHFPNPFRLMKLCFY